MKDNVARKKGVLDPNVSEQLIIQTIADKSFRTVFYTNELNTCPA